MLTAPTEWIGRRLYGYPTFPRPADENEVVEKPKPKPFYSTLPKKEEDNKTLIESSENKKESRTNGSISDDSDWDTDVDEDTNENNIQEEASELTEDSDSESDDEVNEVDQAKVSEKDKNKPKNQATDDNNNSPGWKLHTYFQVCAKPGNHKRDWKKMKKFLDDDIAPGLIKKLRSGYYPQGTQIYTDGTLVEEE